MFRSVCVSFVVESSPFAARAQEEGVAKLALNRNGAVLFLEGWGMSPFVNRNAKEENMGSISRLFVGVVVFMAGTGTLLAQDGGGDGGDAAVAAGLLVFNLLFFIVWFCTLLLVIISFWKLFSKAGRPGWASLVPIYNVIVLWEISEQPIWALITMFIPCVSVIGSIMINLGLAKAFGKGTGFALGLLFFPMIFYPILAFGSSEYKSAPDSV